MHPAESARRMKAEKPENWCSSPKCLWNVRRSGPCPRHMDATPAPAQRDLNLEAQLIASIEASRKV
jgi:hypothetical protein